MRQKMGTETQHPKNPNIDKMHAYRDSIRNKDDQRVVRYAAIMYPGKFHSYKQEIEALPATFNNSSDFNEKLSFVLKRAL